MKITVINVFATPRLLSIVHIVNCDDEGIVSTGGDIWEKIYIFP